MKKGALLRIQPQDCTSTTFSKVRIEKKSEKYGCWVWLRYDWHNGADYGVHGKNGHALDIRLKQIAQEKFEEKYSHELFMQVFKRNYLE